MGEAQYYKFSGPLGLCLWHPPELFLTFPSWPRPPPELFPPPVVRRFFNRFAHTINRPAPHDGAPARMMGEARRGGGYRVNSPAENSPG